MNVIYPESFPSNSRAEGDRGMFDGLAVCDTEADPMAPNGELGIRKRWNRRKP